MNALNLSELNRLLTGIATAAAEAERTGSDDGTAEAEAIQAAMNFVIAETKGQ